VRSQSENIRDRLHAIWFDDLFKLGSFGTGFVDTVWSGCVPQHPHMVEVCSKLGRRRFFR